MCRKLRPEITKNIENQSKNIFINTDRIKATSKIKNLQILIKEALFQCTFCPSLTFVLQKIFFYQNWVLEISVTKKWGPGGKI